MTDGNSEKANDPLDNSTWIRSFAVLCVILLLMQLVVFLFTGILQNALSVDVFIWWLAYCVVSIIQPLFVLAYLSSPAREIRKKACTIIKDLKESLPNLVKEWKEVDATRKEVWLDNVRNHIAEHYHPQNYIFPFLFLTVVNAVGFFILFSIGFPLVTLGALDEMLLTLPPALGAGFIGGWFYALYSVLRRYRTSDISPGLILQLGYQILIATAAGFFVGEMFEHDAILLGAFALGFVPYSDLVLWIRSQAETKLGIQSEFTKAEGAHEHLAAQIITSLQGITRLEFERLSEEGITTIQHLAFANPLSIYLMTSFGLNRVVDWMDQAYLRIYLNEETCGKLAHVGIRGAIELSVLNDPKHGLSEQKAKKLAAEVKKIIGIDSEGLEFLVYSLKSDPRVMFLHALWNLYGGL